ncbi:MAG TPA: TonB-dependent receptor plug domain-containing protein [Pyrinomonadaceae bacterium]|nr:TonB-dependent receptor plug domain-containing protein [Pyrinomonadaceae bacterium]HMP66391.1 TonB-dependent receptor plug domain-containing protein [Pyrinomonadaceae bacterium]
MQEKKISYLSGHRSSSLSGRLLTAAFLLAALAGMAFGQSPPSMISVRIIDQSSAPVAGAVVKVTAVSGTFKAVFVTDANGEFSFSSGRGEYVISAAAEGFALSESRAASPAAGPVVIVLYPRPIASEVVVSANYVAGSQAALDEVPGAVERLDRHTLENSRVFSFSEALRKISGLNLREEEGFGLRVNIGIRGTNPTRSTKVLLLEDGIPLGFAPYGDNASYYHPPVERYSELEVLKGSGQIVYGPQTIGGVVNYITPDPSKKPRFALKLAGGSRDFLNGSVSGSGTIRRTGIFANYTRKQGKGSRENISSELNDISTKVVQTLNQSNALTFKFSYYGEDSNTTYSGLTTAEYAADPRQNPFRNDFFFADRYGLSLSHSAVLSPSLVLTTTAYSNRFARDWWRQSSNSNQRPNRLNVDPDCLSMADLNTTCGNEGRLRKYGTHGIAPQLTFQYRAGTDLRGELKTGFRVHWETQDRRQENGDLPSSRSGVPSEINRRDNFALSGFVQNRFVFGSFAVTPGIRFEQIDIERRNLLLDPIAVGKTSVREVIPGVGVAYSGLPRTTIFAGVHRGFSPPRAEDIINNTGGVIELEPERSWNYEAGVRSIPVKGIGIEATFFRLDYENQIVPASLAGGVGAILTNGGQTLQQGFEISGRLDTDRLFPSRHNFFVRTAITWLPTAEFRGERFSTTTSSALLDIYCPAARRASATSCSVSGNRLPYVPEGLVTTSVGYSHAKGFQAFIENVYIGSQFGDDLNANSPTGNGQIGKIGSQTYWNATANYHVESIRTTFFVSGKNLFDRTFIVDRSRGILPSGPRMVLAGVKIELGR